MKPMAEKMQMAEKMAGQAMRHEAEEVMRHEEEEAKRHEEEASTAIHRATLLSTAQTMVPPRMTGRPPQARVPASPSALGAALC